METETFLRFGLALVFVLALIGLLGWAIRRFGIGGRFAVKTRHRPRIAVVEAASVDGKRRLVLVRRDNLEHLILLGPSSELLIERGIPANPHKAAVPSGEHAGFKSKVTERPAAAPSELDKPVPRRQTKP